jgi:hypothetical protein
MRRLLLAVVAVSSGIVASGRQATIRVDAGNVLHQVNPRYIGVNPEDLNHECYGGLYSQLIPGESFQEHIDAGPIFGLTDRPAITVANALQAWQQDLVFDQGETVFTASQAIPQPSSYVDRAIARNWASSVVGTTAVHVSAALGDADALREVERTGRS